MAYRDVTPTEAQKLLQENPKLGVLDVRTPHEYRSHRVAGAKLLPVQELADRWQELDAESEWLVLCEHGGRSAFACELLGQAGFRQLVNMRGGMAQWLASGLPVQRG